MKIVGLPADAVLLAAAPSPIQALGTPPRDGIDRALSALGTEAIREIETDICYPATGEEYVALGKNGTL